MPKPALSLVAALVEVGAHLKRYRGRHRSDGPDRPRGAGSREKVHRAGYSTLADEPTHAYRL
eukprot:3140410-Heterocapsa_arctica.AAC.1